jgi:hypothetical protein
MIPGIVSHFFVSCDNLEGKEYMDFISERKKFLLGSNFVKINKKRIRKRCLESFLKDKLFANDDMLLFERSRFLKSHYNVEGKSNN